MYHNAMFAHRPTFDDPIRAMFTPRQCFTLRKRWVALTTVEGPYIDTI
jgi:hypothetical protein